MRHVRKLAAGLMALVLSTSAAMAADPIIIPPPAPPPPAPVAYDWGGFNAGLHSGSLLFYGGGIQAGFNIQRGKLVFGFGGRFGGVWGVGPPPLLYAGGGGKIGVALGATGNVLLYGTGAYGVIFAPGLGVLSPFYLFGTGVELGLSPRASVFGEILAVGIPGGGGCCNALIAGGVNFHFGN